MNVYYGINEKLWKGDRRKTPLKEFPVTQNFLWGTREIHIPALYIGKDGVVAAFPHRRIALSSMHFEPVREIRWRAVFQVKPMEDLEVDFPISF